MQKKQVCTSIAQDVKRGRTSIELPRFPLAYKNKFNGTIIRQ